MIGRVILKKKNNISDVVLSLKDCTALAFTCNEGYKSSEKLKVTDPFEGWEEVRRRNRTHRNCFIIIKKAVKWWTRILGTNWSGNPIAVWSVLHYI